MRAIDSVKQEIEKELVQPLPKLSIVRLVDLFVEYAYTSRASDIHIQPEENGVRVRFRVEGLLRDVFNKIQISNDIHAEIITRIKVISGLRTDEHASPQDGRFKAAIEEFGNVDVRVSIMPTHYGENAILRILAATKAFVLEDLGFSPADLERVERSISRPYGMILANGPTGSGKNTKLYTILKKLNRPVVSIITVEDPIEYSLDGITQIQVNSQVGLTFANGLRSILRQDPNVIMVGEIRDQETANIAVNAALTGHLVLSTLHTNDAATTFPRLLDMGVPSFLVASTVNIVMNQRLVRMLCPSCKQSRSLSASETKSLKEILPVADNLQSKLFSPKGCAKCDQTGYASRIGVREVLEVNDEVRRLVMNRASAQEIKQAAIKNGMTTMVEDGLAKARAGLTSLEEVLRIIHE
ncbi:MAG: type II/IV secretion system protein [Candidatus Liptonbacteria bacterium]|nr:type II/IV secretion system protein [Candidatus Liptonbacteria bacterium]